MSRTHVTFQISKQNHVILAHESPPGLNLLTLLLYNLGGFRSRFAISNCIFHIESRVIKSGGVIKQSGLLVCTETLQAVVSVVFSKLLDTDVGSRQSMTSIKRKSCGMNSLSGTQADLEKWSLWIMCISMLRYKTKCYHVGLCFL